MNKTLKKSYDCIIIGAGNGGLAAAIRILEKKLSCLVLEKHNLPGGFATSFRRGRFEFEASLHELNDFGPKDNPGDVRTLFRSLGVEDKIDWIKINEAYHLITRDGKYDVVMPFGVEEFKAKMVECVPDSKKSIDEFFELAKEIVAAQAYTNSVNGVTDKNYMIKNFPNFIKTGSYSVNEVLHAIKMPQKAIDILNAYWCYLGVDCDRMSFIHYTSMVYRYITKQAWMPSKKSHEISLAFEERIRELGGDIFYNSEVTKILTGENREIQGVMLNNGTIIHTHHIIANCSPLNVYGHMLDKKDVTLSDIKAVNSRMLAGRGICMFLGLNKSADELGIESHNYFIYDTADTKKQYDLMKKLDTNYAQATVCLNRADPNCSPKGTTMMYFTTLVFSDDWSKVSERDYFKEKDKFAAKMIDVFEKATGTHIKDSIEEIAFASPTTYARYCGHPQGVIYGYEAAGWDALTPRLMMMKDDYTFKGLRFCGGFAMRASGYSSAYFSGDISGRQTAGEILREGK